MLLVNFLLVLFTDSFHVSRNLVTGKVVICNQLFVHNVRVLWAGYTGQLLVHSDVLQISKTLFSYKMGKCLRYHVE